MEFIKYIRMYSLQRSRETTNTLPFPIQFITNICLLSEYAPKCRKKFKLIYEFLHEHFMTHCTPEQMPKLFAIISTRYMNIETDQSSFLLAMKYMNIYQTQRAENKLTELSIIFDEQYPEEAVFKGCIYNSLSQNYLERWQFPNGIEFQNETCKMFLDESDKYFVYLSIDPLDFAMDLVQILVKNDFNITERYQLRYKRLIKYIKNSYFALSPDIYCEQQGRILILLSRYYLRCRISNGTMNAIKAKKYATMAIDHLNEYIVESKFLVGAYGVLYNAEKSLFNINNARNMIKMQCKLLAANNPNKVKKFHSDYQNHLEILNSWKDVKNSRSRLMKLKKAKNFYVAYWDELKPQSLQNYGIDVLNQWIGYITNDKYYQIMKNICMLKECNYSKCKRKDVSLLTCSRCVSVYYCCRTHQKIDWNLNHRNECKELIKRNYMFTLHLPYTIPVQLRRLLDSVNSKHSNI